MSGRIIDGKAVAANVRADVTAAVVQSITVDPVDPSLALGLEQQFTATGTFSDNSVSDITEQAVWTSSDDAVASVANAAGSRGLATTSAVGATTITATLDGVGGSSTLTVTEAVLVRVEVSPTLPSLALGRSQAFVATAVYTDNSTVPLTDQATWLSSDEGVATISNLAPDNGLATSVAPGVTTISATFDGQTGATDLTVTPAALDTIVVSPAGPSLPDGRTVQMTAEGHYSDGTSGDITTDVVWSTGNAAIAAISNAAGTEGLLQGESAGQTNVDATMDGVTGTETVTITQAVLESLTVSPDPGAVPVGKTLPMKADGLFSNGDVIDVTASVTWETSTPALLSVSNIAPQGVVTGIAIGNGAITGGGMRLTPRAVLDDGLLDALVIKGATVVRRLVDMSRVSSGRHVDSPGCEYVQARSIAIVSKTDVAVSADGELIGTLPARFECSPRALRVHCPPGNQGTT